jgi:hypothetical protein
LGRRIEIDMIARDAREPEEQNLQKEKEKEKEKRTLRTCIL